MNPYIQAQRAILSIIIQNGKEAFEVADRYIEDRHFTELKYKMLWRSIKWLFDNDHEITDITVKNSMQSRERDSTGQVAWDLLDPHNGKHEEELYAIRDYRKNEGIKHLQSYMDIILDKFKVQKILEMAQELMNKAKDGKSTTGQLQSVINKYSPVLSEKDRKQPRNLVEITETLIEKNRSSVEGDQSIVRANMPKIDEYVWFSPGNQTIIGGDTGHGKTSLALQITWNIAKQVRKVINLDTGMPMRDGDGNEVWTHRRTLFFSLEMREDEILTKLCCIENNISVQEFQVNLSPDKRIEMLTRFKELASRVAPNFMIDSNVSTLKDIISKSKMVYSSYGGLDLIVVDYLQLVEDIKDDLQRRREDEVYRNVSRQLKKLAMSLETHTLALSQLNKPATDKNGAVNHRPTLDRLFGSSALKQDASNVLFVYREWAVDIKQTVYGGEAISSMYITRIVFAKNRFGYAQVEVVCGFIPYLTYILPLQVIKDANLLHSKDPNIKFPKIKEFME